MITPVTNLVLGPERVCPACDSDGLTTRSQRHRRVQTFDGALNVTAKLAECPKLDCPTRGHLISPSAELQLALPMLSVGWDVLCWIGHRRLARDWRVGQIREELLESYEVTLSADSIERYIARYEAILTAREQDPARLKQEYRNARGLILTIDGLQPEKGHETLYVVRELLQRRVLFAAPLLSSAAPEIAQLLNVARTWAEVIAKPVLAWMSDKQDAFVTEIATIFPGVPHRYCANHFLRDAAKPILEADAHAKVQMRRKVRGLRAIEREVLSGRATPEAKTALTSPSTPPPAPVHTQPPPPAAIPAPHAALPTAPSPLKPASAKNATASEVVLEYCAAVRGILNDDQGGPLHPPGLRMAEALGQVRTSLQRLIDIPTLALERRLLCRLAGCIDHGVSLVRKDLANVREHVVTIGKVQKCLEPQSQRTIEERKRDFDTLASLLIASDDLVHIHIGKTMRSFAPGLFVGGDIPEIPSDNLDLERAFKHPKRHCRRIHGRAHAGASIVQTGPTLLASLGAHLRHPAVFTARDLLPYRHAEPPPCQREALQRRTIMRAARSKIKRPRLLKKLERSYLSALGLIAPSQ